MYEENKFELVSEGKVVIDYGPITMSILAKRYNKPFTEAAIKAAEEVIRNFDQLIDFLKVARISLVEIDNSKESLYPLVLRNMIDSIRLLGEKDFTPMAAVAGTFADLAKEEALKHKADFVIANNGGDVAFQTSQPHNPMKVGIISDLSINKVTHMLKIDAKSEIKGIATSGYGGRSLTKGVASAVTVLARNSSFADAAATAIANAVNCDDIAVVRCLAEEIDYNTDIKGALVTKMIGKMADESIETAINIGEKRAKELYDKGMILGAIVFVQGKMSVYPKETSSFNIEKIHVNPNRDRRGSI